MVTGVLRVSGRPAVEGLAMLPAFPERHRAEIERGLVKRWAGEDFAAAVGHAAGKGDAELWEAVAAGSFGSGGWWEGDIGARGEILLERSGEPGALAAVRRLAKGWAEHKPVELSAWAAELGVGAGARRGRGGTGGGAARPRSGGRLPLGGEFGRRRGRAGGAAGGDRSGVADVGGRGGETMRRGDRGAFLVLIRRGGGG